MSAVMPCAIARELMLDADLPELTGTADTELARHISACAECHAVAQRLLDGYAELDRGLSALASHKRVLPMRKRWSRWTPLPLAAAAVLALLVVRPEPADPPLDSVLARLMFPEPAVVSPPPGKQAVIIEKNDLTVVWLY